MGLRASALLASSTHSFYTQEAKSSQRTKKNHANISFLVLSFLLMSGEACSGDLAPFIFMNIGFCLPLFICTVSRRKNCFPPLHKLSNPHRSTIRQKISLQCSKALPGLHNFSTPHKGSETSPETSNVLELAAAFAFQIHFLSQQQCTHISDLLHITFDHINHTTTFS